MSDKRVRLAACGVSAVLMAAVVTPGAAYSASGDGTSSTRCSTYAAAQIGAMLQRPKSIAELLGNVKVALAQALLLQSAFYREDNLKRFFNAIAVTMEKPVPHVPGGGVIRPFKIEVDSAIFPGMTVVLQYGLIRGHAGGSLLTIFDW